MKIQLNISERLFAISILNAFKGSLDKLAIVLDDIRQLPVSEEEWKAAGKSEEKINTKDGEKTNWTWDDAKGGDKEIELQKDTVDVLVKYIKEKDEKGEFTLQDKSIISLYNKLK